MEEFLPAASPSRYRRDRKSNTIDSLSTRWAATASLPRPTRKSSAGITSYLAFESRNSVVFRLEMAEACFYFNVKGSIVTVLEIRPHSVRPFNTPWSHQSDIFISLVPPVRKYSFTEKNSFVTATKLGTTNKFLLLQPKILLQQPNFFFDRTKHFVVTKYFCYSLF